MIYVKKLFWNFFSKGIRLPISISIVNFIFQRIFRIDSDLKYSKYFTSRVIGAKNLIIENESAAVLKSLALSGSCYIQASEGVYIGEGTIWSANVAIISQGHDIHDLSVIPKNAPIKIGKNCWLGTSSTLLPGICLGDKTIVGANSVVTKSFLEGNCIIAGCPARIIRRI